MRGRGNIAGNPVLIGAATVLVVIVAVFLAYNANQGLPFVPTYQLKVDAPSGANLVRGNEVRIGGARVGSLSRIQAVRRPDGTSFARLTLKLDKVVQPLAKDSRVLIRPRSALGLKYVELTQGRSEEGFADGGLHISLDTVEPEPTLTADGAWWHPVGVTNPHLKVAESPLPLAPVLDIIRDVVAVQAAGASEGRQVFRCT